MNVLNKLNRDRRENKKNLLSDNVADSYDNPLPFESKLSSVYNV